MSHINKHNLSIGMGKIYSWIIDCFAEHDYGKLQAIW